MRKTGVGMCTGALDGGKSNPNPAIHIVAFIQSGASSFRLDVIRCGEYVGFMGVGGV